jgi:hypothetical protein
MNALGKTLCAILLTCGIAGSAAAATNTAPAGSAGGENAAPPPQAPSHISERLRNDLTKAGFTDITIMPSSFLVRAKDSQGNPVMMVINPDSLTELTEHSEPPVSGAIKGAATGSPSAGATNAPTPPARP